MNFQLCIITFPLLFSSLSNEFSRQMFVTGISGSRERIATERSCFIIQPPLVLKLPTLSIVNLLLGAKGCFTMTRMLDPSCADEMAVCKG